MVILIGYLYNCALQRDLTLPFVDDGLFEVVGFRDAWHGLVLMAPNGHGTRLAQVRYQFCDHSYRYLFMYLAFTVFCMDREKQVWIFLYRYNMYEI